MRPREDREDHLGRWNSGPMARPDRTDRRLVRASPTTRINTGRMVFEFHGALSQDEAAEVLATERIPDHLRGRLKSERKADAGEGA
jgi:hypothetical protein